MQFRVAKGTDKSRHWLSKPEIFCTPCKDDLVLKRSNKVTSFAKRHGRRWQFRYARQLDGLGWCLKSLFCTLAAKILKAGSCVATYFGKQTGVVESELHSEHPENESRCKLWHEFRQSAPNFVASLVPAVQRGKQAGQTCLKQTGLPQTHKQPAICKESAAMCLPPER